MTWKRFSADELLDHRSDISNFVEKLPSVYMWKRNFRATGADLADAEALVAWLDRVVCAPVAELDRTRIGHFLVFDGLSVSGELTDDKRAYLLSAMKNDQLRQYFKKYLLSLAEQAPALYVGETDNMARRVLEHLDALSDFGEQIKEHPALTWSDLDLWYWVLSQKENADSRNQKRFRTAIEAVTANLTIAGLTKRPG